MGYQWWRKRGDGLAFGIRNNDHEDTSEDPANWALYSARPGTVQRMPLFLYPTLAAGTDAIAAALEFTHGDTYRPLAGFKVLNHHYHTDIADRALAGAADETRQRDLAAMKATGINIVSLVDTVVYDVPPALLPPPGAPAPFWARTNLVARTDAAFTAAAAASDRDFLVWPNQEIYGGPLGGHTDLLFSHKIRWQPPLDRRFPHPTPPGPVYQVATAADLLAMAKAEGAVFSMPHPRTKGSTGFPDAIRDQPYFTDPRFTGAGMRWGMGLDGSEERLCEYRCWPLLDEMSNWMVRAGAPLKKALSISEVRHLAPGDDVYGSQPVTYIKLDALPTGGDFAPVIAAITDRESFWTTGEVLARNLSVKRVGSAWRVSADVDWTFPLAFVEVHYGNGTSVFSRRISAADRPALGRARFSVDIPARQAQWVRFSAWDIASNGAVIQPVLTHPR